MTSRTSVKDRPDFDIDGRAEDGLEVTKWQQVLDVLHLVAFHLRRTVVFVPIFGVVYLIMGFLWYQDLQAERTLEARSDLQLVLLAQPAPHPDLVLKQIEGWDTAYQVTLDGRIRRTEDSDLVDRVIAAASLAGLEVIKIGTTDDDTVTVENDKYTSTPVLMAANGDLDGIEQFLDMLETDKFAGFEVQSSMLNAETNGYVLTLVGVFYSLPENYGDGLVDEEIDIPVIPINQPVGNASGGVTR